MSDRDNENETWRRRDMLALSFNGYEAFPDDKIDDVYRRVARAVMSGRRLDALELDELRGALFLAQRGRRNMYLFDSMWPRPGSEDHDVPVAIEAELRRRMGDAWAEERMATKGPDRDLDADEPNERRGKSPKAP